MSTMSTVELQREIKNSVVTPLMQSGIGEMNLIQIDNFKWLVAVDIEGQQYFAEVGLTAKKADFSYDDAVAANRKFEEKCAAAAQRETDRAAKRAEKLNSKGESRNSSGNNGRFENGYIPYDERYKSEDF